jgi:cardiolipin synthase
VQLLVDGPGIFPALLELLASAVRGVEVGMFIWRDDTVGREFARAILAAADRGVPVRLVKDLQGAVFEWAEENRRSFLHPRLPWRLLAPAWLLHRTYFRDAVADRPNRDSEELRRRLCSHPLVELQAAGIRRDHSKYYLIDDTVVLGGANIEDKAFDRDQRGRVWRDYMVALAGRRAVEAFRRRECMPFSLASGGSAAFVFNSSPGQYLSVVESLLRAARTRIVLQVAYLGRTPVLQALEEAAGRGVELEILAPAAANLQSDLNRRLLRRLLEQHPGRVRVFLSPEMVHAKVVWVDGRSVLIGSGNLNRRSWSFGESGVLLRGCSDAFWRELEVSYSTNRAQAEEVRDPAELTWRRLRALVEGLYS